MPRPWNSVSEYSVPLIGKPIGTWAMGALWSFGAAIMSFAAGHIFDCKTKRTAGATVPSVAE
ncbi:hypothetical protein [Chachezhania antarctica]|mgnify:CR=1 FL=1|uniref:hypothetical protein n=1 Tax=Chachezhania antarctica TaxID=2340860 RepID=UPI0013CF0B19|nr:hypothetical protein [Chachezhania antarctica]|tara:strand:+ start:2037 stop:2222 length:186 start_codon:yes stop_codon:yes gene_type:complete